MFSYSLLKTQFSIQKQQLVNTCIMSYFVLLFKSQQHVFNNMFNKWALEYYHFLFLLYLRVVCNRPASAMIYLANNPTKNVKNPTTFVSTPLSLQGVRSLQRATLNQWCFYVGPPSRT